MRRFLIVRTHKTRSGIRTAPVAIRGMTDALTLCGPSVEYVMTTAKKLGLHDVVALELDDNDRPVTARGMA